MTADATVVHARKSCAFVRAERVSLRDDILCALDKSEQNGDVEQTCILRHALVIICFVLNEQPDLKESIVSG